MNIDPREEAGYRSLERKEETVNTWNQISLAGDEVVLGERAEAAAKVNGLGAAICLQVV